MNLTEQRVRRPRRNRKRLTLRLRELWTAAGPASRAALAATWGGLRGLAPYAGVTLLVAAIPVTAVALVRYLTSSDHFALSTIQVEGNAHASEEELLRLASVWPGRNVLTLDTDAIEAEVERHPWVRSATVEAELPDRLVIRVEERRPIAVASLPQLQLVDDRGVVFEPIGAGEVLDLPVITGVTREELADPEQADEAQRRLREAVRVADWYVLHPVAKAHPLGEVHVDPLFGYTVVMRNDAVEVRLGLVTDRADLALRLGRLEHVMNDARTRGARVVLVRLDDRRDPTRVTVRLEYPNGAAAGVVADAESERPSDDGPPNKKSSPSRRPTAPSRDHILP